MSLELKDKIKNDLKKRNISTKTLLGTVENSINGIKFYAKDGKSIIIYLVCAILEIIMGFEYQISGLEWILIICILGITLSIEIINTAIEAVCDAVSRDYNYLIKISKDCGSAATFVVFVVAIILNIIIFLPKVVALF